MSWTHYYGAFVVSKPHTWPNGVQIMRMAMTLFWPLDGWKCHNAFVWCIYYTAYICACANGAWVLLCAYIRFIWKLVWMWMKLHLVEKWPTNVSSHTKHYLAFVSGSVEECWFPQFLSHILDPLMVRGSNIIFLGSHAYLSSFVCLCKTIMDIHHVWNEFLSTLPLDGTH